LGLRLRNTGFLVPLYSLLKFCSAHSYFPEKIATEKFSTATGNTI
jgi:hypothetical protein